MMNGVVTYVVAKREIVKSPLGEREGRRLFEKPIPELGIDGLFEREAGKQLFLEGGVPKQPIQYTVTHGRVGVNSAPVAEELAELGVLARHVLPRNHSEGAPFA